MLSRSSILASTFVKRSNASNRAAVMTMTRAASSSSGSTTENNTIVVYESKYGKRIRTLRRISLVSTILSSIMLPGAILVDSGVMSQTAQLALAGTVWFSSVSSTLMLQVVGSPYVFDLTEVQPQSAKKQEDRILIARKISVFGRLKPTEFRLADAQKSTAHPFASFKVDKAGFFYIFGGNLEDASLREKLCKD